MKMEAIWADAYEDLTGCLAYDTIVRLRHAYLKEEDRVLDVESWTTMQWLLRVVAA